jgi:excisionase family DNA binding protein
MESPLRPLLSPNDVAFLLGLSKSRIMQLISGGEIPFIKIGEKDIRFDQGELRAWLETKTEGKSVALKNAR